MYCSNCGKEISEGSVFCKYCGTPQGEVSGKADYSAAPKKPQININYKKVALIAGPIAVVAALVIVGIVLFRLYIHVPSVSSAEFDDVCDAIGARKIYTTELVNNGYYLKEQIGNLYANNLEEGFYITVDERYLNTSEEYGYLMRSGLPGLAGLGSEGIDEISYLAIADNNVMNIINDPSFPTNLENVQFDILNAAQITLKSSDRAESFMDSLSYWLNMIGVNTDDCRFWEYRSGSNLGMMKLHLDFEDFYESFYNNCENLDALREVMGDDFEIIDNDFRNIDGSINILVFVNNENIVVAVSIACNEDSLLMSDFCSAIGTSDVSGFASNDRVTEGVASVGGRYFYLFLRNYIERASNAAESLAQHNMEIEMVVEQIDASTTEIPAATATPTPVASTYSFGDPYYFELAIIDPADEDDEVVVYGFNDEVKNLINTYSDITVRYEQQSSDTMQQVLDNVLASGEDAPDLFACDADYARKYLNSDNTLPINDLGIAYMELANMYNYTLQYACDDDNIIKGLAWQACPCGVFYNRTVAQNTLGVSEPEDVAPYFESWGAFLQTARTVHAAGYVVVSSQADIDRSMLNSRTQGWIVNGDLYIDPVVEDYFDLQRSLYDEGLTHYTSEWSQEWIDDMSNETVLSYWGPMWLAKFSMALDPSVNDMVNPTSGDWGIVAPPGDSYWGGTWLMASKYCNSKASVAQIMRDICINTVSLQDMANNGEFVNNISIMDTLGHDDAFCLEWLGGQNPIPVLLDVAVNVDCSIITMNDGAINDYFFNALNSYIVGDISSVAEAEASFYNAVQAAGII